MPESQSSGRAWFLLLVSLAISFGLWHWATRLLIPTSTGAALAAGRPIGNNSDLYPRWLGARDALIFRRDPYSAQTTRQIQAGFYGRTLDPARPNEPADQQAFAYPLYVVFLMAPTLSLPFSVVMPIFGWALLVGTALSVWLWGYALCIRLGPVVTVAVMILSVSNYPMVQGFYKQQLTYLVAFFMALGAACVMRGWLVLAGLAVALSTIKPQVSGLFILLLIVWTLGDWKRRQRLAWSFAASMAVLLGASELLLPDWIPRFIQAIREYERYAGDTPLLQVLLGHAGGIVAAVILFLFVITTFWRWRKSPVGSTRFAGAIALAVSATLGIINKTAPYNSVLLIPALLALAVRHGTGSTWNRAAIKAAFAAQGWQWMSALGLSVASLTISTATWPRWAIQLPLGTVFALPPLVLIAVLVTLRNPPIPQNPAESRE
jgi:hypothetical protein